MKLVHQINLAFGLSLVLILSVTAVLLHYVLLDHFIGTEKNDLKTLSAAMSASITKAGDITMSPVLTTGTAVTMPNLNITGMQSVQLVTGEATSAPSTLIPADVEAFVTDFNGNVLSGTLSVSGTTGMASSNTLTEAVPANLSKYTAVTSSSIKDLWKGTDGRYVMDVSPIPQGTLTLLTPMSKIKAIEQALLGRLILVICIVGAIMFLLSLFITKRLIQPLMNLKQELKKVKQRHFTDVQLVKAGGEIGAVAQTVYEMAGELNRFNEVQKQFFQNASHELKTPLMSIAGYAEGIRDGIFEGENVRKGLDVILGRAAD